MQTIIFIIEKTKKYRQCPALVSNCATPSPVTGWCVFEFVNGKFWRAQQPTMNLTGPSAINLPPYWSSRPDLEAYWLYPCRWETALRLAAAARLGLVHPGVNSILTLLWFLGTLTGWLLVQTFVSWKVKTIN